MRLVQADDRPAYLIVDRIKNLMLERRALFDKEKATDEELRLIRSKINSLDDEKRLLETNLSRALIQEIEGEDRAAS